MSQLSNQLTESANAIMSDPFRKAVASASIISIADRTGKIKFVNEKFVEISGYSEDELIGKDHRIINSHYHPRTFWQEMWKTISSGKSWRAEVRNRNKNGSHYWVDTFIMPFEDENGNVTEFLSIRNDITDRKHSEQALSHLNAQLHATLVFGKMGSALLNINSMQIDLSTELLQILESTATEKTMSVNDFLCKYVALDYLPEWQSKIEEAKSTELSKVHYGAHRKVESELLMVTDKGKPIWAEAKLIKQLDDVIIIFQDVTDRKFANDTLSAQTNTINTILNGITDGFFALDANFIFTIVSPVFASLANAKPEDLLGRKILDVFPFMAGSSLWEQYTTAFATQAPMTVEHLDPLRFDGAFSINIYPTKDGLFVYYKDISASRKAEISLVEKSTLFQRLSENVPGMIYNCYLKGDVLHFPFVSSGAQQLLGITDEELMRNGNALLHIVHPGDLGRVLNSIRDAVAACSRWTCEFRIMAENSSVKWIAGDSNPYQEQNGVFYWYGFMHDITASKSSEQKLIESELKTRLIIDNSGEGILFTSPDGRIFSANPAACKIFGRTNEELCQGGRKLIVDTNDPRFISAFLERQETGQFSGELTMKRKDGTAFTAEIASKIFVGVDGESKASMLIRDITERKQKEDELKRLALIASKTASVVIATDIDGHTVWVNDAFERITGYSREEAIGKKPGALLQGPATSQETVAMMRDCLREQKGFKVEVLNYSKSGEELWLDIEVMPVTGELGEVTGYIAIQSVITDLKKAIKDLRETKIQVQNLYDELNAILNASTDATIFLDKDLSIRVFNKTAHDAIANIFNREVKVGDSMLQYSTPQTVNDFIANFNKALTGIPVFSEREIIYPNNLKSWTQARYQPVFNKSNEIIGVCFNATDVTHRKLSDQKLFQSKQYFESLVNSQSTLLLRTDPRGTFTFVNDTFCNHFGLEKEFVIGENVSKIISLETLETVQSVVNKCVGKLGAVFPITLQLKAARGRVCWMFWEVMALGDEHGIVQEIQAVGVDITQQVLNQRKLEMLNSRLQMATSLAKIGVWEFDYDTGVLVWDDMLYRLLGFDRDIPISPAHFDQQIEKGDLACLHKAVGELTPVNDSVSGILRITRPDDGRLVQIKYFCQAHFNEEGILKRLVGVDYDVTEQEVANQSIRESEQRFRTLANTAPVFIWVADAHNNTTFLNNYWYDFTGGTPETQLGKGWLQGIHPEDAIEAGNTCANAFAKRQNIYMEYRLRRHDGEYRWMVDTGVPRYLETGEFVGYVGSCFDITERKQAEKRLGEDIARRKESERMLKAALADKDLLIKEIHHRIKNNLQLISSMLYIKMAGMRDVDTKTFLDGVRQKIRSIALIHERLLQAESVNMVNLSDYLKHLIEDIRAVNSNHGAHLTFVCEVLPLEVSLDTAIFCGLIVNEAVTNSIKHAFIDRSSGQITIRLVQEDSKVLLQIADDGTSIPDNISPGFSGSYGMQLISIFARQLNAELTLDRSKGTTYTLKFKT